MNRDGSSYNSRTGGPLPWRFGFVRMDELITEARRAGVEFGIEVAKPLFRATIGEKVVGLLYPYSSDIVRWPHVIEEMTDARIAEMMHRLAESDGRGVCYFIGGDEGAIKIGYSVDVQSRLRAIQSHSPVQLRVLATRAGGAMRERAYHAQFAEWREHGEWFARSPEIEAEISRLQVGGL